MTMQGYNMPAVCSQCGELFDLSYDMKKNMEELLEKAMSKRNKRSNLCWECRYS
mgnify:FL=1